MLWYEELDQKVKDYLPSLHWEREAPMARHTSFQIGGPARRLARPSSGEETVLLVNFARACGARPLVIGRGTNLLVSDQGIDRLVIDTRGLDRLEERPEGRIFALGGVSLARLAEFAAKLGLTGLEFAHGIPGSVGGAMCMNAGAYGGEMRQVTAAVTVLDPQEGVRTLSGEEMCFAYRTSILAQRPDWVVLGAEFALTPGDPAAIRETMLDLQRRRRASQPLEYPSAGSTFKRPEGNFAGTLIDRCGLKGLRIGGAQVSEKHAGFVINRGGATFADVTALIAEVQRRVRNDTGILLEVEVRIVR